MDWRQIDENIFISLDKGEKLQATLLEFWHSHHQLNTDMYSGKISGIGALENIELGFYNLETKTYEKKLLEGNHELISLTGNLTYNDNNPFFHLHAVVSDNNFQCFGGHLFEATVAITSEIHLNIFPSTISRKLDSDIGLNLIKL